MIIGFVVVLSPIILIHELGHFLACKWFGIHVEEFGLGFPPRAYKLFEHKGTTYSLNWIPLGGFVRPAGEDNANVADGLASASKWARFVVLAAGAIFNFILAFLVLWVAFIWGQPHYDESKVAIASFSQQNVAEAAGLQINDVFVAANGEVIGSNTAKLQQLIGESVGRPVELRIERNGVEQTLTVTPIPNPTNPERGILGVGLGSYLTDKREALNPISAARESLETMWNVISLTVRAPAMLIRGQLTAQEARPVSVVGISQIASLQIQETRRTGDWFGLLYFIALINVGLGFTNLLPLPALDGGRILFVLIEWIRGRKIPAEREGFVHFVGMMLLLSLMFFMIIQDIINPIIQ